MSGKATKTLTNLIIFLLFAALALGVIFGAISILTASEGMYVTYNGKDISNSSGISLEWNEDGATFTICNTDDWGAYNVTDCTATIVPNVTSSKDFNYSVSGESKTFSVESDLTAAFIGDDWSTYDGNGFEVNSDGEFTVTMIAYTSNALNAMKTILTRAYGGSAVTMDETIDILSYPYFAIKVVSPDGNNTITIPFSLYVNEYYVTYNVTNCTSSSSNPSSISVDGSAQLNFSANSGYLLPDEITVTGATLDGWDSTSGVASISNLTGCVVVTVTAAKYYSISYNLTNCTAYDSNVSIITEGSTVYLYFACDDGYTFPSTISSVTGVERYVWTVHSNKAGRLRLVNPTDNVVITIVAESEGAYTVSGVWQFESIMIGDGDIGTYSGYIDVDFTCNGVEYSSITWSFLYRSNSGLMCYDGIYVFNYAWVDDSYMIIDFGDTPQAVNETFYQFLTDYATQVS